MLRSICAVDGSRLKTRVVGCMLTHLPHIAVSSLPLLLRLDLLIVLLPEMQNQNLLDLLDVSKNSEATNSDCNASH